MRKLLIGFLVAVIGLTALTSTNEKAIAQPKGKEIKAILAFHPNYLKQSPNVLPPYQSVLQEEGVPYEIVDIFRLASLSASEVAKTTPVVIMPDGVLQNVSKQFVDWIKDYLANGGNIMVIYDVGVKNDAGFFQERAAFADITGINYITYKTTGAAAYGIGNVHFSSEASRDFYQIPLGKTMERVILSSYGFGHLKYPIARTEVVRELPANDIHAYGVTEKNEKFPLLVLTDYAKGKVLYVNLPLGYIKGYEDDLPMRAILRTFLFDVIAMPHVMNVEHGRGGLVLNWHVDSDVEHTSLPFLLKEGWLRKSIKSSYHVTAGDSFEQLGDRNGFDAAGRGKIFVKKLMEYGRIGSHGGWAHNWFSNNILSGAFGEKEIYQYIKLNNDTLEKITGYKVTEYAAPTGVHPQPVATNVMEKLGIVAYYYTGDSGSAPNRTFTQGKMITEKVIAFPIMPAGLVASTYEMSAKLKYSDSQAQEWLFSLPDYVKRNRSVRMFYSHPYDIHHYPKVFMSYFDKLEAMQAANEITIRPMTDVVEFMFRFLKTTCSFDLQDRQMVVSLANPESLSGITIAIPKTSYNQPAAEGISVQEDERYYYVTVATLEKDKQITFSRR